MKNILLILLFACSLTTVAQVPQGKKTKQNTTTTPLNTTSEPKRDTFTDTPLPTAPKNNTTSAQPQPAPAKPAARTGNSSNSGSTRGKGNGKTKTTSAPTAPPPTVYTLPSSIRSNTTAATLYQKAMNDDVQAMCDLGKAYLKGTDGAIQNDNEAFRWLKKSAEAGNAHAMAWLGHCYYVGTGTAKNYEQCFYWDKKSADLGDPHGIARLGACYDEGVYVSIDYAHAIELYRKAAEAGDALGQRGLGVCFIMGRGTQANASQGVYWLQKSAAQNYPSAVFCLGQCYEYGYGVTMDKRKAFEYYEKAKSLGEEDALWALADCYFYGNGTNQNKEYAKTLYYDSAINKSSVEGKSKFAEHLFGGSFGAPDLKYAFKLFNESSNNYLSQFYLAYYYFHGIEGVRVDKVQAFSYYKSSAEAGYAAAMNQLGVCYEGGYGCSKNLDEAAKWYKKAADLGNYMAMSNLGRFYAGLVAGAPHGDIFHTHPNIPQIDYTKAFQLFKTAAEADNVFAKFWVGYCYHYGNGAKKNKKIAEQWFGKACGWSGLATYKTALREIKALKQDGWKLPKKGLERHLTGYADNRLPLMEIEPIF